MIITEKNRRLALEIIRLVYECGVGMRQRVSYYRNARTPQEATNILKSAVRLPYRVEHRVQFFVTKYGATRVNQALSLVSGGSVTLSDLQTELVPLKAYADQLTTNYQINGWTEEQIAADIEANADQLDTDLSDSLAGYVDEI